MEYTVYGRLDRIDFGATGVSEVLQNVRTLLCTKKYSVPLDRDLGLEFAALDMPLPKSTAALRVEIVEAIRSYEPRAKVLRVDFAQDSDAREGVLVPVVTVDV